jgi:hypothetical protein
VSEGEVRFPVFGGGGGGYGSMAEKYFWLKLGGLFRPRVIVSTCRLVSSRCFQVTPPASNA